MPLATLDLSPADTDDLYLATEGLCLVCNYTFHAALGACPTCKERSL